MPYRKLGEESREVAEAYYWAWLDDMEPRLAAFVSEVEAAGGPAVDYSPDSLDPLWAWLGNRATVVDGLPADAEAPGWFVPDPEEQVVNVDTLWRIDAYGRYLGEVCRRHLDRVDWRLEIDERRGAVNVDHHWPVIDGPGVRHNPRVLLRILLRELTRPRRRSATPGELFERFAADNADAVG